MVLFIGCGHHHRSRRFLNVAHINSGVASVDTSSLPGVSVSFWDQLSDEDKRRIINEILSEVAAWEIYAQQPVINVVVEVVVTNTIENDIEIEITDEDVIVLGFKDGKQFYIPRGKLYHYLCKAHKKKCKDWCAEDHDEDEDDEQEDD